MLNAGQITLIYLFKDKWENISFMEKKLICVKEVEQQPL